MIYPRKVRKDGLRLVFSVCKGCDFVANEQNLITPQELNARLTPEQRKANASKAGIASGQRRRENKLIKDRILERMGESDWDLMIDNLIARAQEDTKSFETLRDTLGQKPKETLAVENEQIVIRLHHDD